jgi:hypothetical protein
MQALKQISDVVQASERTNLTLRELLSSVSRELSNNATLAHDCQDVIAEMVPFGLSNSVMERIQGVDLFSQILVELAELLSRAVESCPADLMTSDSLLTGVRLAALRDRLEGRTPDQVESGDAELW